MNDPIPEEQFKNRTLNKGYEHKIDESEFICKETKEDVQTTDCESMSFKKGCKNIKTCEEYLKRKNDK